MASWHARLADQVAERRRLRDLRPLVVAWDRCGFRRRGCSRSSRWAWLWFRLWLGLWLCLGLGPGSLESSFRFGQRDVPVDQELGAPLQVLPELGPHSHECHPDHFWVSCLAEASDEPLLRKVAAPKAAPLAVSPSAELVPLVRDVRDAGEAWGVWLLVESSARSSWHSPRVVELLVLEELRLARGVVRWMHPSLASARSHSQRSTARGERTRTHLSSWRGSLYSSAL